ncbi:hypothetical protein M409DRAFT_70103 [Zasmidium cellare ATCC 36951]|uniref:DNA/RNA-binding domain-containing protein n=1 Tax=Zasmidium cellare ATCC 36951 TaxID=1080233 RepID=A0A6A6C1U7_ZASCE|nr:uncharacterized protein M409DRAFT_70103 [Zasmidium cellare ATCC 36951]KAF2161037.1 hypothetical protein M409DRAFT_70103 [Zasmidium cellare ATCC 36951]
MVHLLEQQRATEQYLVTLLKTPHVAADELLAIFQQTRLLAQAATFADFQHAESHEMRLWNLHGDGKRWFSRKLRDFRKKHADRPVEERQWAKQYLTFLKESERYYRSYIHKIDKACGGIPELEAIAHASTEEDFGESQTDSAPTITREAAVASCHRNVIYLGDLARYRASDKLDRNPDFGRAVGWYKLATDILPSSGHGHHQLAVVTLEDQNHLQGIYHFYRSLAVPNPHPNAKANLGKEFEKTNAAWDRGELIQKGPPNDPDASKRALVGWFVRFHSMCYKGEVFRGHAELEREVLSQLSNVIKQRPLEPALQRMLLTNMAAQYVAGEAYQGRSRLWITMGMTLTPFAEDPENLRIQQSFFYYFQFNVKTFTTLLQLFYDDLRNLLINLEDQDIELAAKLTPLGRRLLPCLRVYSSWLMTAINLVKGLFYDPTVGVSVQQFWPTYARVIDLIAQAFPIWDLDDVDEVEYLVEEDVETREFKPVCDELYGTDRRWNNKQTGVKKPCCTDKNVVRLSPDEEMLHRVKEFLADGLNLANTENMPISLRGTRIFSGSEDNIDSLVVRPVEYKPAPIAPPKAKPKPVSYAAAAANGHAKLSRPLPVQRKASAGKPQSRDAQLSRMVDDLVDDDDGNNPVTPPQQHASNPAVVTNGEAPQILQDSAMHDLTRAMKNVAARPDVTVTPPAARPTGNMGRPYAGQHQRMQSVSKLWGNGQGPASSFPNNLPAGTPLGSPMVGVRGHSRGNSASSIRSRASLNGPDPWGSDSAPRTMPDSVVPQTVYGNYSSLDQSGMGSPLLFGAGGGPWSSTNTRRGYRNVSPPNGQGG